MRMAERALFRLRDIHRCQWVVCLWKPGNKRLCLNWLSNGKRSFHDYSQRRPKTPLENPEPPPTPIFRQADCLCMQPLLKNLSVGVERLVYKNLTTKCGVKTQDFLLLCVSGGSDSMALLHLLTRIREVALPTLQLAVVNFNHKLRPEADEEARFVEKWARTYDLPVHLKCPNGKIGTSQQDMRVWRRSECIDILRQAQQPDGLICTGHQQGDQVETVLLKLLRGSHLTTLSGMQPRSGPFLKPLLNLSKSSLQDYLRSHKLEWREDASNATHKYTRNALRLDLVPVATQIAGGESALSQRIQDLSDQSMEMAQWVHAEAKQFIMGNVQFVPFVRAPKTTTPAAASLSKKTTTKKATAPNETHPVTFSLNSPESFIRASVNAGLQANFRGIDSPVSVSLLKFFHGQSEHPPDHLDGSFSMSIEEFRLLPPPVQAEVIHRLCQLLSDLPVDWFHTSQLRAMACRETGGSLKTLSVNERVRAIKTVSTLTLCS